MKPLVTFRLLWSRDLTMTAWLTDCLNALTCRLTGHKWEAQETYYPGAGTHYEGEFCTRCWAVDYAEVRNGHS